MEPQFTDQQVREHAEALAVIGEIIVDDSPFTRELVDMGEMERALAVFASFPPDFRADMYSSWRIRLDEEGPTNLDDAEIFLFSYGVRDGDAWEAAQNGESVFGGDWYQENVHYGVDQLSLGEGQPNAAMRDMMQMVAAAGAEPEQIQRVNALQRQAFGTPEPVPMAGFEDKVFDVMALGYLGAGAVFAGLIAAPAVIAAAATPAGGAVGTAIGAGGSALLRGGRRAVAYGQSVSQAWQDARLMSGEAMVPVRTARAGEVLLGLETRLGTPVANILQNAAARTGSPAVQRAAGVMTAPRNGAMAIRAGAAAGVLSFSTIRALTSPDEVQANQDLLAQENIEKEPEETVPSPAASQRAAEDENLSFMDTVMNNFTARIDTAALLARERSDAALRAENYLAVYQTANAGRAAADGAPGPIDVDITSEDITAMLLGTEDVDKFKALEGLSNVDELISETAMIALGGEWYDPEVHTDEVLAEEGLIIYDDITSYGDLEIRRMVFPAPIGGAAPEQTTSGYEAFRTSIVEQVDSEETDPLIRVPEGYIAKVWKSQDDPDSELRDKFIGGIYRGTRQDRVVDEVPAEYRDSMVFDQMSNMSPRQVFRFQALARDANYYDRPTIPGQFTNEDQQILSRVMGQANVSGRTFWETLQAEADEGKRQTLNAAAANKGATTTTTTSRDPFSVPASLRSIPGAKTVAEEAKARFKQKLGRDAMPDELSEMANELTGYHEVSNREQIALYLAAYNGDNQGLLTGAQMQRIEDPGAATSFDISEKWENEIDLNARRESNADSFKRMLSATMGNRPSVGNLTAAGGVQQIGRQ